MTEYTNTEVRRVLSAHYEKRIDRLEATLRTIANSRTMDVGEIRRLARAALSYFQAPKEK